MGNRGSMAVNSRFITGGENCVTSPKDARFGGSSRIGRFEKGFGIDGFVFA